MNPSMTIERLAQWLRAQDDIALLGHVMPDGDATGSVLGMWHALRAMGKRVVPTLPGGIPSLYTTLPGASQILDPAGPLPFVPKAALSLDVSDMGRLGDEGRALFEGCPHRAMLDHHFTNEGFGELWVVDGEAAATGELAVDLIDALGITLSRETAECLFVAISTDCGQFSYTNTRGKTLRAAARCVDAGIDVSRITEELYRTRSVGRTKLLGVVLAGLELSPDGTLAWARLTEAMLRDCGAGREDSEGIINYLLEMAGVKIAVLASERGETTKLSLRSRAPMNVARDIAVPLGGGGHDCAAGVNLNMPLEEGLQTALTMARKALKQE